MPITSLREIRILKSLDHPNVVPVVDIAIDEGEPPEFNPPSTTYSRPASPLGTTFDFKPSKTYMVFPYMDHDLAGLLENREVVLKEAQIKQYARQLLEGTYYMHRVSARQRLDLGCV